VVAIFVLTSGAPTNSSSAASTLTCFATARIACSVSSMNTTNSTGT
jgi:hypothetical protein